MFSLINLSLDISSESAATLDVYTEIFQVLSWEGVKGCHEAMVCSIRIWQEDQAAH